MPSTSEARTAADARAAALIASLHQQPLLVVLRADQPEDLSATLVQLVTIGVKHVEIAWSEHPAWSLQCAQLSERFAQVRFGAASVVAPQALQAVAEAGLSFAVSPVLDADLLAQAEQLGITLVPGVLSPSEVHIACRLGCAMVKLFPAAAVGRDYWQRLRSPLGELPFCIAAGGLGPEHINEWLAAGVDAVALGGGLRGDQAWSSLQRWLADRRP